MERKFIVDGIEGNKASLEAEDGTILTVDLALLPAAVAEGDIVRIFIDHEQTGKKKEEIQNLLNDIFR
jgi:hypothetical protein